MLCKIHSLKDISDNCTSNLKDISDDCTANQQESWYDRYFTVIEERMEAFRNEKIHFEGDDCILQFLGDHASLLRERPSCYLHGDYHMGNMILSPEKKLNAITSIVWAKYYAPKEYSHIIQLNQNILKWFDGMNALKPSWYQK